MKKWVGLESYKAWLSLLKRKWHDSLLGPLAVRSDKQVFHVYVSDPQRQSLSDSATGVQQQQS